MLRSSRLRTALVVAAGSALSGSLLAGCAASSAGGMAGMDMSSMHAMRPSGAASMVCGPETRTAVQRTLLLAAPPRPSHSWRDMTYTCTYRVAGSELVVSVQDARNKEVGTRYFQGLEQKVAGATPIRGLQSLGFPAFQTGDGQVAFVKDGKTLRVDARRLPGRALPAGVTRTEAAYGVAAAVLACWSE